MIRIGIIGATGYAGEELIKILLRHPQAKITYLAAIIDKPSNIAEIFPHFKNKIDLSCGNLDMEKAASLCDLLFLALPHTVSMDIVPKLLKNKKKVIDLSADYRLKNIADYKKWYSKDHTDPANLKEAVYGLPEYYKNQIKGSDFISNPGCYPTAAILSINPFVKSYSCDTIIIDAKSGVTGAGRKAVVSFFFSEVNESLKAYKINEHQHMPEIEQELSNAAGKKIKVNFIPHLIPINRGILETIYIKTGAKVSTSRLLKTYKDFYADKPFVRVREEGNFPEIKDVANSNFCDIGIKVSKDKGVVIIVSTIDNLIKGAAGQAVQNMNIMYGFPETEGLL